MFMTTCKEKKRESVDGLSLVHTVFVVVKKYSMIL